MRFDKLKKKSKIIPNSKEKEIDFDEEYYKEETEEQETETESVLNKGYKNFIKRKSRLSPHIEELAVITQIRSNIHKYAVRVERFTQDIEDLWQMYSLIGTYWSCVRPLCGQTPRKEIKKYQNECLLLIEENMKAIKIDRNAHKRLIFLRDLVFDLAQTKGLGFITTTGFQTVIATAEKAITET